MHRLLLTLTLATATTLAAQTGAVQGRVTDNAGLPLSGVTITLLPTPLRGSYQFRGTKTDQEGRFILKDITVGKCFVVLSDDSRGVTPRERFVPFQVPGTPSPKIDIRAFETADAGTLKLPATLASLTLILLDANTGKPIRSTQCELSGFTDSKLFSSSFSLTGQFLFLLPPMATTITVKSGGYSEWVFAENGHQYLELRRSRTITAYLNPLTS